jgi:Rnl2 family RNA ligase
MTDMMVNAKGFSEYEHMENHYNLGKICDLDTLSKIQFVCTEKIHGTNYSFLYNGKDVIPCKRSSKLGNDTTFMNHTHVFSKYETDIKVIFEYLQKIYDNIIQIRLYGELFGGFYNGKTKDGHKNIQKGVNYHPENEFMAYDLKIQTADKIFYYDYLDLQKMFHDLGDSIKVKHVPVIANGTYDEVIKLDPKFESIVYSYYDLPKLEKNYAEGYVIRSVREMNMMDSTGKQNKYRLIFKFKNPKFAEVTRVHAVPSVPKEVKPNYFNILKQYLTEMRYDNVKSKLSDDEQNKLKEMLFDDVLVDFIADNTVDDSIIEVCKKLLPRLIDDFLKKIEHK